ncbi:MAG: CBS domain-containing protein [Saprospiraceae bacterium]|jgi:CBS domain-containing protein|nr:CBS domain-containing protein [Candidatus Opimibacter skivensis]MBL0006184.1 CBS domain-containing protein [Candidatus Opimibacter skivensis]HQW02417.1 CBS domain-containing protein [Saprospiraceae bacterium]
MMNEPLSSIMTRQVITAGPDDKLSVARDIFRKNRVHHLPIVHGTQLIGILTTYDIFKMIDSKDDYDKILIKDVMTTHVATLEPEDKVGSAAELFLENLFHAVPIVKDGELKGIVTSFDVIKYEFHKEYPTQEI